MAASPVSDWLVRVIGKGALRIELWTWRGDRPERQVSVWKSLEGDHGALATEMQGDAENHGRSQNGQRVKYALLAHDAGGDKVAEHFLTVAGGNAQESSGIGDVSDLSGVVAHLIKGNNDLANIVIRAFQGRDETLIRQLEILSARLDDAERRNAESLVTQQKFILLASEQKRMDHQLQKDLERDQMIRDALTLLAPMIANRALGGGPGKGAPAGDAIFSAIASTLSPEDVGVLGDMLRSAPIHELKKSAFLELLMSAMVQRKRTLNAEDKPNGKEPTS